MQRNYQHLCLLLALAVVVGACSVPGSDRSETLAATTATTTAQAADDGTATTSGASDAPPEHLSALEEFFGFSRNRFTAPSEQELAQAAQVQQLIAECMNDEGFEYVPEDPGYDETGLDEIQALSAEDFAAVYGYGITTVDARRLHEEASEENPNDAIRRALSPEGQRAYTEALSGAAAAADKYGEPIPEDADATPGCEAEAEAAVYGDRTKEPIPVEFDALREAIDVLETQIANDQRVAEAADAWSDCLSDAGLPGYDQPGDPQVDITNRHWDVFGLEPPEGAVGETGQDGVFIPGPSPSRFGTVADPEALAELQDYEIAVAVVDLGCRSEYDATVSEVRDEVEQAFIDSNRSELERFKESMALAGDGDN